MSTGSTVTDLIRYGDSRVPILAPLIEKRNLTRSKRKFALSQLVLRQAVSYSREIRIKGDWPTHSCLFSFRICFGYRLLGGYGLR